MYELNLNGKWTISDGEIEIEGNVPCSDYKALLDAHKIPDPFYGTNEKDVRGIAEKDWTFSRSFYLDKNALDSKKLVLRAEMLDTIAEIRINGELAGSCDNAFKRQEFNIAPFVREGENALSVAFKSPLAYVAEKQKKCPAPNASMGVNGVPHIRKPQCHFGWDWGPILPVSGILKDIGVIGFQKAKIDEIKIDQTHNDDGSVKIKVAVKAELFEKCRASVEIVAPDGAFLKAENEADDAQTEFEFLIEKPELWYTRDLSERDIQPLYTVKTTVGDDAIVKKIGLRTIRLNRDADAHGRNFCFEINGVPIFAKGANWIPADSFIERFDKEKLKKFIDAAKFSNFNMIRVWGGGYYESDEFYDACDEAGILIWQDLGFACAPYPFFQEEFLNNVKSEIEYNVKRLRHRASLAVWCGNNEIEMMTIGWRLYTEYVKYEKIFFYDILPPIIGECDGVTPFIPGTPCGSGGFLKKVNADEDGDTHLWHVWHGLQPLTYYRKRLTRFCSEFGLESLPDMKTIKSFARPEDYDLKSEVFKAHQKCDSGNNKMLYYISTRFRIPKNFEDTVYLSQIIQSECVKDATLHWRRNRGVCNGSLYWQFNDCWPVTSWSSIDYFGRYKALQYAAKSFMRPVALSLKDEKARVDFYALNDTMNEKKLSLKYTLRAFDGKIIKTETHEITAAAISAEAYLSRDFKKDVKKYRGNLILSAELSEENGLIDEKTVLFKPEKNLALKKPQIQAGVRIKNGKASITLKTDFFARYVRLTLPVDTIFSENFFDLVPGVEKTVTCDACGLDEKAIEKSLEIASIADVEAKGGAFSDFLTRTKIALIPINVANRIYYHTV